MKNSILIGLIAITWTCTSFKMVSPPNWRDETKDKDLRILVISDLNAGYGSTTYSSDVINVVQRIAKIKPDLILCGGDMVAGQKSSLTPEHIGAMWNSFDELIFKPITQSKVPFGFTVGNHDAAPNFDTDRAMAKQFWTARIKSTGLAFVDSAHYPFYFSYLKNNVFIMSWDAAASKIKPEVFAWMQTQLAAEAAKKARMRILLGHLPLYAIVATKNKPGEVNSNADSALKFFKTHGVDLYISGHQHAYFPAEKQGVQLLNLGCIGDGPRPILGYPDAARKAYTVISIPAKSPQNFTYKTWMPTSNIPIGAKHLPDSVVGFNGMIKRSAKVD